MVSFVGEGALCGCYATTTACDGAVVCGSGSWELWELELARASVRKKPKPKNLGFKVLKVLKPVFL